LGSGSHTFAAGSTIGRHDFDYDPLKVFSGDDFKNLVNANSGNTLHGVTITQG